MVIGLETEIVIYRYLYIQMPH